MAARSNADFYGARGIEPSIPLQATAAQRGLPVTHGVLPQPELTGPFRCRHSHRRHRAHADPVDLLRRIKSVMAPDGICLVVTPDVGSVAARAMGWKWWRFHAAHIGYFNKSTLALALETAGLRVNAITRPSWRLPSSYLAERAFSHLPRPFRPALPSVLDRIVVPTNLYDSLLAVCGHSPQAAWPQRHPRSERPLSPKGHSGNVRPNLFPVELHRIRQNSSRYLIPVRVVRSATGVKSCLGITNR